MITTPLSFDALFLLAQSISVAWEEKEAVDWSEAEQLINVCREIPQDVLNTLPDIQAILAYADDNDEWDSGYVGQWPDTITESLAQSDKDYGYRHDLDHWEVFSLTLSGEEEWKATVETETIAQLLVNALKSERTHV